MRGLTTAPVVFLHGLESSPSGSKARYLRDHYRAFTPPLTTREFDKALEEARQAIAEQMPMVVVGSSFGGAVLLALLTGGGYGGPSVFVAQAGVKLGVGNRLPEGTRAILLHGTDDDVVPIEGSRSLARTGGAGVELVEIEGGDHRLERALEEGTLASAINKLLDELSAPGRLDPTALDSVESAALAFALSRHFGQRYGDRPYVDHLAEVRRVLEDFQLDGELAAAAWLHDIVEDTGTPREEIAARFGDTIDALVWAVTGTGEDRPARNASAYGKIADHPPAATLKLADRIANVEASARRPDKLAMYRSEWQSFSSALAGLGDERLWSRLRAALGV